MKAVFPGAITTRRRIYSTTLVHNVRPTTPMNQPSLTAVKVDVQKYLASKYIKMLYLLVIID